MFLNQAVNLCQRHGAPSGPGTEISREITFDRRLSFLTHKSLWLACLKALDVLGAVGYARLAVS